MKSLPVILWVVAIGLGTPNHATPRQSEDLPAATLQQASGISLGQAVAMVQSRYNAKVMRADSVDESGRLVHYIRLRSADGARVWTVRIDAASGREF